MGTIKIESKSENIDDHMESKIVDLFRHALDNKKGLDFITKTCQESFGGSWILIYRSEGYFDMSFAFISLKWIKLRYGGQYYYLFQISK